MTAEQVGMMPIYIGDPDEQDEGLATGSENYWCINSKASEADQKATAEFLKWVITSDTGKEALSTEMGFTTPFKTSMTSRPTIRWLRPPSPIRSPARRRSAGTSP